MWFCCEFLEFLLCTVSNTGIIIIIIKCKNSFWSEKNSFVFQTVPIRKWIIKCQLFYKVTESSADWSMCKKVFLHKLSVFSNRHKGPPAFSYPPFRLIACLSFCLSMHWLHYFAEARVESKHEPTCPSERCFHERSDQTVIISIAQWTVLQPHYDSFQRSVLCPRSCVVSVSHLYNLWIPAEKDEYFLNTEKK